MRNRWLALAVAAVFPLAACEGGQGGEQELETELETTQPANEMTGAGTAGGGLAMEDWDTNADQQINNEEFGGWFQDQNLYQDWNANGGEGLEQEEFSQGIFETWDADDDQGVTEQEWNEGASWFGEGNYGTWGEWDANGDSVLDANEVAEGLESQNLYDRVDRDSDALIDDEELTDWWFDIWDGNDDQALDTTEWDEVGAEWSRLGLGTGAGTTGTTGTTGNM